jgi:hypothetical protein
MSDMLEKRAVAAKSEADEVAAYERHAALEEQRVRQGRIRSLEERFPEVIDLSARNRAVYTWMGGVSTRVKDRANKRKGYGYDVAVSLGESEAWPGLHKVVRLRHSNIASTVFGFVTDLVKPKGIPHNPYGLDDINKGLIPETAKGSENLGSDMGYAVYGRFPPDQLYQQVLDTADKYNAFTANTDAISAWKRHRARVKGAVPPTPESVLASIATRIDALESMVAMVEPAMHDPSRNGDIVEALKVTI